MAKPTPHDGHICEVDTIFDTAFCCDFSISVTDKPKNCVTRKSFHVAWEASFKHDLVRITPPDTESFRKQCALKKKMPKCCSLSVRQKPK